MMLGSFDEFLDEKQQIVKDRALESENISRSTLPALACRLLLWQMETPFVTFFLTSAVLYYLNAPHSI